MEVANIESLRDLWGGPFFQGREPSCHAKILKFRIIIFFIILIILTCDRDAGLITQEKKYKSFMAVYSFGCLFFGCLNHYFCVIKYTQNTVGQQK